MTMSQRLPMVADVEESPLAMPDQDLTARFTDPAAPGMHTGKRTLALRAVVLAAPVCVTAALAWVSLGWFALDGRLTLAEGALIVVSAFAFFWMVFSVFTAALGLLWSPQSQAQVQPLYGLRVAILLPMYGEAAERTIAHAATLLAGLPAHGRHRFSLHILSDTRGAPEALAEEIAVAATRQTFGALAIHYRRRGQNTDFKSGNIRAWVQAHGHAHDAMLILDADSIMGPQTVLKMADALALEPGLGLIQTVPIVLPGTTLWQGMQCFASRIYGANMGRGFAMWAGVEANFLGHNALVRVRAFAASAGLPHLRGRAPRGGVILSHDFVEAALLRRAGWGVRMLAGAEDSFEDTPETLNGFLRRDRRWCQGNMQHLALILAPGLHPMSRFHLLQGAMAYLASVWWLILLVLWALPGQGGALADVFAGSPFMPNFPALPALTQGTIALTMIFMLIAPKALGIIGYIRDTGLSRAEAPRFVASVAAEVLLSALLAPLQMVHQVRAVLQTLAGYDGGWKPHQSGRSGLRSLLRFYRTETALGLGLLGFVMAGLVSTWLLPMAISLCLAVPLALLVQRPARRFIFTS
jgi:membrane glycosyltransferase